MHMTRRGVRAAVALLAAMLVMFGITSAAMATVTHKVKVQRIYHPCDLNKDTRPGTGRSTERMCLRVWDHHAYTVSTRGRVYQETPAGPAVVVDLIDQAGAEGRGSARYFRGGLFNETVMYAKRDR
jgi:hypothetical protein